MDIAIKIIVVLIFILINALFSGTEMAVISLSDIKERKLAEEGNKHAKKVLKFIDDQPSFLSAIQVGVTLAGFLASAFASEGIASKITLATDPEGTRVWMAPLWTVLITLVLSYITLVAGELVPKRIAARNPEKWAYRTAGFLSFFMTLTKPLVIFLTASSNLVLRIFGISPEDKNKAVTEEEIMMMVDAGSETGSIEDSEKEMIENVFDFNDTEVSEIMTHRKKIVSLPIDASYAEVMKVAISERHTRIPVYRGTIDDIVGILHIKDLLAVKAPAEPRKFNLRKLIREPLVVHETRKISSLFAEMRTSGMQMAIVIDEYGGTMGICTLEDIIEEIVGNISDEFDVDEEQQSLKLSNGDYIVAGDMPLADLEDILGIKFDEEEYDTMAGLVLHVLDRIPEEKEKPEVIYKNLKIKVLHVQDRWISKVMIHVLPVSDDPAGEDEDE
ncbi:MAG: HlyC/CorC family transporter [Clostridiales bacterium]|nr:HlyC/CorC family transporter [Clostridiales bacterium]